MFCLNATDSSRANMSSIISQCHLRLLIIFCYVVLNLGSWEHCLEKRGHSRYSSVKSEVNSGSECWNACASNKRTVCCTFFAIKERALDVRMIRMVNNFLKPSREEVEVSIDLWKWRGRAVCSSKSVASCNCECENPQQCTRNSQLPDAFLPQSAHGCGPEVLDQLIT